MRFKFAKRTTKAVITGYLVDAHVKEGKYFINVQALHGNPERHEGIKEWIKSFNSKHNMEDWQVSLHANLKEVKSAIMVAYGMAWFNRARSKIKRLEA